MKIIKCNGFDDVLTKFEDYDMIVIQMEETEDYEKYFELKEYLGKNFPSKMFQRIMNEYEDYLKTKKEV